MLAGCLMTVAMGWAEHFTCTLERVVQRRRWLSASRVHALEPLRQSPSAQHCPTRYFEPDAQRGRQMFCEARLRRQVLLANSQGYYATEQYWPREHLWRTLLTCVMFEQTFASLKVCTDASFKSAVFASQFGYNFFVTKLFMFLGPRIQSLPFSRIYLLSQKRFWSLIGQVFLATFKGLTLVRQ